MAAATPEEIEAQARRLLRDQLEGSAWFRNGTTREPRKRIDQEVDAWWHLKIEEAADHLAERATPEKPRAPGSVT